MTRLDLSLAWASCLLIGAIVGLVVLEVFPR